MSLSGRINIDKLIEEVKRYPVLYDKGNDKYKNNDYKNKIWRDIAKHLNADGGGSVCKVKWNHIRDQYRKTLKKRKSVEGIEDVFVRKYKYEDMLDFLLPHLSERGSSSSLPFPIGGCENEGEEDEYSDGDSQGETLYQIEGARFDGEEEQRMETSSGGQQIKLENCPSENEIFPKPSQWRRRLEDSWENAPSQLLSFLLQDKEAERMKEYRATQAIQMDPIDLFLSGIASTLKTLNPLLLNQAKSKIFSIVQEMEMKQLMDQQNPVSCFSRTGNMPPRKMSPPHSSNSYCSPSPSSPTHPPADT